MRILCFCLIALMLTLAVAAMVVMLALTLARNSQHATLVQEASASMAASAAAVISLGAEWRLVTEHFANSSAVSWDHVATSHDATLTALQALQSTLAAHSFEQTLLATTSVQNYNSWVEALPTLRSQCQTSAIAASQCQASYSIGAQSIVAVTQSITSAVGDPLSPSVNLIALSAGVDAVARISATQVALSAALVRGGVFASTSAYALFTSVSGCEGASLAVLRTAVQSVVSACVLLLAPLPSRTLTRSAAMRCHRLEMLQHC